MGARFSHRRTASCDLPACDAPVPQPEVESSVESSEDAGIEQDSAPPADEAADGNGNADWTVVEDQPVSSADGVTSPENVTLPENAPLDSSETVSEVDGAFEQEPGRDLDNGFSGFEIDASHQNDSEADDRDPVTAETESQASEVISAHNDVAPESASRTDVESSDESEQPEGFESGVSGENDFVPLDSSDGYSRNPEATPTLDAGESILSRLSKDKSGSWGHEWIRNSFLDSPARLGDEGPTSEEAGKVDADPLRSVPNVADVANNAEPSIQSNRQSTDDSSDENRTTNVLVVVNVPPTGERQPRSMSEPVNGQTNRLDDHVAEPSDERSIVLRAVPAESVTCQTVMIEENLAIPPARPEPLAPLRASASIWAAESVDRLPSHQASFIRPVDQQAVTGPGRCNDAGVDRVNRGIRLRELPALLRMPQTPSPTCWPRPLNATRARSNAARSGRWDEIKQLPVRLRAIPQDSYGTPTSTGSRARIRVIQPSFQRQVDPDRDARMEDNQTRANPQSLPAIDVERFDRELRTLAERPPSDGDTRVRR